MSKKQTEELSKSKAKRQERQKEVSKAKRHKLIGKIVGIVVAVYVIFNVVRSRANKAKKGYRQNTAASDYSRTAVILQSFS